MTSRESKLLLEIEEGALDENTSIASVLRKCIALGGKAGSTELRDWASRELNGYEKDDTLPAYRVLPAPIQLDAVIGYNIIKGQTIPPHELPDVAHGHIEEKVSLFFGIAEIEDMARHRDGDSGTVKIMLPKASILMGLMGADEFEHVTALYWGVSKSHLRGVIDRVRTTCTSLVAELRSSRPETDPELDREAIKDALNVAITGKRNVVQFLNPNASHGGQSTAQAFAGPSPARDSWWKRWRNRGIVIGIATIVATAVAVATWIGWKPPWR